LEVVEEEAIEKEVQPECNVLWQVGNLASCLFMSINLW